MNKKTKTAVAAILAISGAAFIFLRISCRAGVNDGLEPVKIHRGDISVIVSTVGTVRPQNRLEIKPPINGRVEDILVVEGEEVKAGDILALMSSVERATLIDAARIKGDAEYRYWQRAYRETPLIAPIDGVVIVRNVEPGQTVGTADAVLVISDRLIVGADVDETDIGLVEVGQRAVIGLDAYPEIVIDAVVDHISYESQIVSNVTVYVVDILPREVPTVFRSGMSANVEIAVEEADDVILIPIEALSRREGKTTAMARPRGERDFKETVIVVGVQNGSMAEVVSGVSEGDEVLVSRRAYVAPRRRTGGSPFIPTRRDRGDGPGR